MPNTIYGYVAGAWHDLCAEDSPYCLWAYVAGEWKHQCFCATTTPVTPATPVPITLTQEQTQIAFYAADFNNLDQIGGAAGTFATAGYMDAHTGTYTVLYSGSDIVIGLNDSTDWVRIQRTSAGGVSGYPPTTNWPTTGYNSDDVEWGDIGAASTSKLLMGSADRVSGGSWFFYFFIAKDDYTNIIEDFTIDIGGVGGDTASLGYLATLDNIYPRLNDSDHVSFTRHDWGHPSVSSFEYRRHLAKYYDGAAITDFPDETTNPWSRADDINNSDIIVGSASPTEWSIGPSDQRAYVWDTATATVTYLDTLFTDAVGNTQHGWWINNDGLVVWGWYDGSDWHVCVTNMVDNVEIALVTPISTGEPIRCFINDNNVVVVGYQWNNKIDVYSGV